MQKYVPYEKMSKKEKKKIDGLRRGNWGGISPVTRKPQNSKAYNRQKAKKWKYDPDSLPSVFFVLFDFFGQIC